MRDTPEARPSLVTDGEFFALFKRYIQQKYVDPTGMPGLQSHDLIRPYKRSIVVSAGASWDRIYIGRAVYIWTPDRRRIDFISGNHPGDLSADTALPWNSSVSGFAKLYLPGEWHIKTPLIGADVEGSKVTLVVSDAALGLDAGNLGAADLIGQVASGQEMDLASIHGTAQTPFDWTGTISPVVWGNGATVTVNAADTAVLAALPGRKAMAFFNASTGGQVIAIGVTNPMTGVLGFLILGAGIGKIIGKTHPGFTAQIIRAYASGAGGVLKYAEAT